MGYNVVSHSFQSYAGMAWQKEPGWKIIARLKTYDISLTNELFKFHWIEPIHWMNIGYFILHPFCVCVCAVLQHARTLFWRQGEMWTWNRVFSMSFHTFLRCARSVQIMNHMKIYEGFKRKWNDFYLFRFFTFVISFHFMKQTNA